MKTCTHCTKENPDDAIYCQNCGERIEGKISRICQKCGKENPDDAIFCLNCGSNLSKDNSIKNSVLEVDEKPEGKPKKNQTKIVLGTCGGLVALCGIIVLVLFLRLRSETNIVSNNNSSNNEALNVEATEIATPTLVEETEMNLGWISFENNADIWVMQTDGTQLTNLTKSESVREITPKLSWDAKKVLYVDLNYNLYVINTNGTTRRILVEGEAAYPSWAPDGEHILYVKTEQKDDKYIYSIHSIDITTEEDQSIYEQETYTILNPVFSPDGTKIALPSGGIKILNADGSNNTILEEAKGMFISQISWSKDGEKLAFASPAGVLYGAESWAEYSDIYVINADGSNLTNITNSEPDPSVELDPGPNIFQMFYFPSWTNEGQIVCESNYDSRTTIFMPYIMNSDGTDVELIIDQEVVSMDYQPGN